MTFPLYVCNLKGELQTLCPGWMVRGNNGDDEGPRDDRKLLGACAWL